MQLEVDRVGTFFCRGQAADVGMTPACCGRSDRMTVAPYPATDPTAPNQPAARVVAIEFTGYITRVSLLVEAAKLSCTGTKHTG